MINKKGKIFSEFEFQFLFFFSFEMSLSSFFILNKMKRTCCSGPWQRPLVGARGAAAGQGKYSRISGFLQDLRFRGEAHVGRGAAIQNRSSSPRKEKKFLNSTVCEFEAGGHL